MAGKSTALIVAGVVAIIVIGGGTTAYFLTQTGPDTVSPADSLRASDADAREKENQAEELVRQARIAELIDKGDAALDAGKLINPPQENALVFYEQALAVDPASEAARNGIENVLARGAASAQAAIRTGQLADAEELMFIVRAIDPNNEKLASLTQALADARSAAAARRQAAQAKELDDAIARAEQALTEQRLDAPADDNALHWFREALRLDPDNAAASAGISKVVDAKIAQARTLLEQDDFEGASAALDAAGAIDPQRDETMAPIRAAIAEQQATSGDSFTAQRVAGLLDEARARRADGQLAANAGGAALERYRALLQLAPDHAAARDDVVAMALELTAQGDIALTSGQDDAARTYHEQAGAALELASTEAARQAYEQLSARLAQLDASARAADVEALLAQAEKALAEGHLRAPSGDNALEHYNQVLAIAPGHPEAVTGISTIATRYVDRATDAIVSGNLALAQEHLASAEQIQPDLDTLASLRGRIADAGAEQGKNQQRTVELEAQIASALDAAGKALNDGRLSAPTDNSALTHFRKVLDLSPGNEAATAGVADVGRRHVANAYFAITNERFEAAQAQIEAAAAIQPTPPDLEAARASLTAARERVRSEQLRAQLDTELAAAQAALSQGKLVATDGDSALAHYQAALALDAGNSVAVDGIKLVFDGLLRQSRAAIDERNFDVAEAALEAASQILPNSKAVASLREQTAAARAVAARRAQDEARVVQLLAQAEQANTDSGDVQALTATARLLNEAAQLAPGNTSVSRSLDGVATSFKRLIEQSAETGDTSATARLLTTARELFPEADWIEDTRNQVQSRLAQNDPQRAARIKALLKRADRQLARFYLTTPANDNATATYKEVLTLDPTSVAGQLGFERVVERYMVLAEQGLSQGDNTDVKRYLDLAATVIPNYGDSRARALRLLQKIGAAPVE